MEINNKPQSKITSGPNPTLESDSLNKVIKMKGHDHEAHQGRSQKFYVIGAIY